MLKDDVKSSLLLSNVIDADHHCNEGSIATKCVFDIYRKAVPWEKASLMTGLDEDGIFKVWAPKEHQDAITKEIEIVLQKRYGQVAAEYLKKVKVVGLKHPITLRRHSGISVLPGTKLHLANEKGTTLTGFFVGDKGLYAISTTHLDDFTGEEVMYETGNGLEVLGKIVSHVSEGDPFREACLIEIKDDQYRNISEYISEYKPDFVTDFYRENIQDIPEARKEGIMNHGPGRFAEVRCKAITSLRIDGKQLRDIVVWTTEADIGYEGQSGSAIVWKSPTRAHEHQLVAMYIGEIYLGDERILGSHAMHGTIDFFERKINSELRNYNPNTRTTDLCSSVMDTYFVSSLVVKPLLPSGVSPDNLTIQVGHNPKPPSELTQTKLDVSPTRNNLSRACENLNARQCRKRKACIENTCNVSVKENKIAR